MGNNVNVRYVMCLIACCFTVTFCSFLYADQRALSRDSLGECWANAADRYGVNPVLLMAIAEQESSYNPLATNTNTNASVDMGMMQINSFWLDALKQHGVYREDLFEPCTNINVGAWVLAQSIIHFGNNWEAVGAYNAGTSKSEAAEKRRRHYANLVFVRYQRIAGELQVSAE